MRTSHGASAIALAAVAAIALGCAAGGGATWTYAPLGPTTSPGASESAGASGSPAATECSSAAPSSSAAATSAAPPASVGTSGSPAASESAATSSAPGASAAASCPPAAGGNVIEIEETSALQIVQNGQPLSQLQLTVGQTYTFRINNTAGFTHDFYLGTPDKLQGGATTGLPGVPINENGVQEFTWTVPADAQGWQFACTVPGHYTTMHGSLVLQAP